MPHKIMLAALVVLSLPLANHPAGAQDPQQPRQSKRPNVLLLLVDDLKPALGCYGDPLAKTPNIDRLARRSMRFDVACASQAVCAPSRFALMLGAHPTTTGLYHLSSRLRERLPEAVTLPQYFARFGYRTESLGKVFHVGHGNEGDPASFQVPHFGDLVIEYRDSTAVAQGTTREAALFSNQRLNDIRSLPRGRAWEDPQVEDQAYADGRVAAEAVLRLQAAATRRNTDGTPFFMAVGFARPHLPFSAPRKYWDLHEPAAFPQPFPPAAPDGAPAVAGKRGGEIANYEPIPENGVPTAEQSQTLIHGYYASVSYMDAQVGRILDELHRLQLEDSTIVLLWGDHGFHLGDHAFWTKHTNYEQACRIPLLIAAAGQVQPDTATSQPAGSVDVFPTLVELAGLPPASPPQGLDGLSLCEVLRDPRRRIRDHTLHVYPKAKLGRAVRTERYRLVEWRGESEVGGDVEYELYDYQTDPAETRNHAAEQPGVLQRLRELLAAYPEPRPTGVQPGKTSKNQPQFRGVK